MGHKIIYEFWRADNCQSTFFAREKDALQAAKKYLNEKFANDELLPGLIEQIEKRKEVYYDNNFFGHPGIVCTVDEVELL